MAYDLTLHKKSIQRHALRQLDFFRHPHLAKKMEMEKLLTACENISVDGFKNLKYSDTKSGGKSIYKISSFEHELVLRLISRSLVRLTGSKQNNRKIIVNRLKVMLQEGVSFKVFKYDISSFYESVNVSELLTDLGKDRGFSNSHYTLLESFFAQLASLNINGLPRGMAISAVMAEYAMRRFDDKASERETLFFYERFVDDIIVITNPKEMSTDLGKLFRNNLPYGLSLNTKKTKKYEFVEKALPDNIDEEIHNDFDFLGYSFTVTKRQNRKKNLPTDRRVTVDISKSKTKKIKTKLVKSCLAYCDDGDFDAFHDRVKLLSGNYSIYDRGRRVNRKAGIYYNYSLVDGAKSISLKELDLFLKTMVLSSQGKVFSRLNPKLSSAQKRLLLKLSFVDGFQKKIFNNFPSKRLVTLMECWKYE